MLLLPLAGFLVLVAVGRRVGDPVAGWIGTVAVAGAFVVACITLAGVLHQPADHRVFLQTYFTWFHVGGLTVPVGIQVDPLSITMCMFITGREHAHPPVLDRVHEGRPGLSRSSSST